MNKPNTFTSQAGLNKWQKKFIGWIYWQYRAISI